MKSEAGERGMQEGGFMKVKLNQSVALIYTTQWEGTWWTFIRSFKAKISRGSKENAHSSSHSLLFSCRRPSNFRFIFFPKWPPQPPPTIQWPSLITLWFANCHLEIYYHLVQLQLGTSYNNIYSKWAEQQRKNFVLHAFQVALKHSIIVTLEVESTRHRHTHSESMLF